ncbi:hypothetical protein SAMN06265378_10846 [Paracoccus sediminis]|uniref:Uncharacterized protein n=1 Tax=Paracoccus sediminis TaxID=1214787 RepID=A0A238X5D4_9RHOB|nr:hypothetical protein SAMN06265378_10846 [Paracoccus sediminis]
MIRARIGSGKRPVQKIGPGQGEGVRGTTPGRGLTRLRRVR